MIWLVLGYGVMTVFVGAMFYGVLAAEFADDEDPEPIDLAFPWIMAVFIGVIWPLTVAVWVLAHLMMKVRVLLDGDSKLK